MQIARFSWNFLCGCIRRHWRVCSDQSPITMKFKIANDIKIGN